MESTSDIVVLKEVAVQDERKSKEQLIAELEALRQRLEQMEEISDKCQQAEGALMDEGDFSSALLDTVGALVVVYDREGRVVRFNRACEETTGYTFAEVKNKPYDIFLTPEEAHGVKAAFYRILSSEFPNTYENHWVTREGNLRLIAWSNTALVKNGQVEFVIGTGIDNTEREKVEKHIAHLASFPQLTPDPILEVDLSGRVTFYNAATLKTLERLSLPGLVEAFLPVDLEAILQEAKETGRDLFQREVLIGDSVFAEVISFLADLNVVARIYASDITERKRAEEALREREAKYRAAIETAGDGFCISDMAGRFLEFNDAYVNLTGYSREELLNMSVPDIEAQQTAAEIAATLEKARCEGHAIFETKHRSKDGRVWPAELNLSYWPIAGGRMFVFLRDITERKGAEEALRESEEKLRLVTETIQDVFWMSSPPLDKIIYVSPAYEHVWGRTLESLYQSPQSFLNATHPEDRDRVFATISKGHSQGTSWSHEYRIIRPDGSVRWIFDRGFPVKDEQGQLFLVTGVATDITERKLLEESFFHAQKMEAVGRLAGGVAHDFNNLLTAIMGYVDMMARCLRPNDPLSSHVEEIGKATDRAAALTRQLLAFSRKQVLQPRVLNFNAVVWDTEDMLRRLIGEDIELVSILDPGLGNVKADPGQIEQVIMNLAVNSRDAMPQGGRLTIETANIEFSEPHDCRFDIMPPERYVMLAVSDTGMGMDEEMQAHLFEPFYTTKAMGTGTGLGLSTVHGIVKQIDGYIEVHSQPGAGTSFKIYLPSVEEAMTALRAAPPTRLQGSETVMVVEDEEVVRQFISNVLGKHGYRVLTAANGGEALLLCEQHREPIHLMLTDVVMPQMSGHDLAGRLALLHPEMKVLYMSGYTEDVIIHHGVLNETMHFIEKPFTANVLLRKVRELLDSILED